MFLFDSNNLKYVNIMSNYLLFILHPYFAVFVFIKLKYLEHILVLMFDIQKCWANIMFHSCWLQISNNGLQLPGIARCRFQLKASIFIFDIKFIKGKNEKQKRKFVPNTSKFLNLKDFIEPLNGFLLYEKTHKYYQQVVPVYQKRLLIDHSHEVICGHLIQTFLLISYTDEYTLVYYSPCTFLEAVKHNQILHFSQKLLSFAGIYNDASWIHPVNYFLNMYILCTYHYHLGEIVTTGKNISNYCLVEGIWTKLKECWSHFVRKYST